MNHLNTQHFSAGQAVSFVKSVRHLCFGCDLRAGPFGDRGISLITSHEGLLSVLMCVTNAF